MKVHVSAKRKIKLLKVPDQKVGALNLTYSWFIAIMAIGMIFGSFITYGIMKA